MAKTYLLFFRTSLMDMYKRNIWLWTLLHVSFKYMFIKGTSCRYKLN